MAKKGYWIDLIHSITDPEKFDAYRKLAGPVLEAAGARFLVRGKPAVAYEAGLMQTAVVLEFDSVQHAIAVHDGPGYQAALKALGNGAKRDLRIVEGLDWLNAGRLLNVSQLTWPDMAVEIDVIAVTAK